MHRPLPLPNGPPGKIEQASNRATAAANPSMFLCKEVHQKAQCFLTPKQKLCVRLLSKITNGLACHERAHERCLASHHTLACQPPLQGTRQGPPHRGDALQTGRVGAHTSRRVIKKRDTGCLREWRFAVLKHCLLFWNVRSAPASGRSRRRLACAYMFSTGNPVEQRTAIRYHETAASSGFWLGHPCV